MQIFIFDYFQMLSCLQERLHNARVALGMQPNVQPSHAAASMFRLKYIWLPNWLSSPHSFKDMDDISRSMLEDDDTLISGLSQAVVDITQSLQKDYIISILSLSVDYNWALV